MEGAGRSGEGSALNCGKNTNMTFMLDPSPHREAFVGTKL
jgi:hypothetical protein